MPNPLIGLESGRASVQPGGEARVAVTITNTGNRVEGYDLRVLGPTADWARVEPAQLSVYPQESGSAEVVFSPPAGASVLGGLHPFGVMVRSTLDAASSAIVEGDVRVEKVAGLQAKIVPVTSSGRWRGQHAVQLVNAGNTAAHLRMTASDPDDAIGFYLSPTTLTLPPGGQATVRLTALAHRPFLSGAAVRLPFEVVGEPADRPPGVPPAGPGYNDPSRPVLTAAFQHKPILSPTVILVAVAVVMALVGIGWGLLTKEEKPESQLADRDAPSRPAVEVAEVGPTSIRLRWQTVDSATGYQVRQVDPVSENVKREFPLLGEVNEFQTDDLESSTDVCFTVRAVRGGVQGPLSDRVCGKTAAPTAPPMTTTPSPPPDPLPPRAADLPTIVATRGQVTIDGNTGDWNWQQVARADQPIVVPTVNPDPRGVGVTGATGEVYLMWDEQALYLLAAVRDGEVRSSDPNDLRRLYRGDAVVLELGPDNTALPKEALARPVDAYYMFAVGPGYVGVPSTTPPSPGAPPTVLIGVLLPNTKGDSFDLRGDATGITAAIGPTADGYVLEARIPWATTRLNGPAANTFLAANVLVTDRRADSFANRGMVATNRQRSSALRAHPHYWQQLRLLA